jgi:hypothetical protein
MNNRGEENMKQIGKLCLLSTCGAISGAGALALVNGNLTAHFGFRGVVKETAAVSLSDMDWGDIRICHSPNVARATGGMIRLALTEVASGALQALQSAPEFADSDPPLWEGLGSITYKITTTNSDAQRFFDQGDFGLPMLLITMTRGEHSAR